jgi:very-short-patch-repair endonuclease
VATDDLAIARIAEQQHGIVTMQQALDLGISRESVRHRVSERRLHPVHPAVYRVAGSPETWRGNLLAACLAAPGPGVASHRSAAKLWHLPGASERLVEITCRRWRRVQRSGLVVHESGAVDAADVTLLDAVPCMTVERTLLSLGAVASAAVVEMAVDAALRRELTTLDGLHRLLRRLGRPGRDGVGVLRRVVERHSAEAGMTESVMETRLKQLLRRHGLAVPKFQYEVRAGHRFVARVDAAYPEHRIAIEYDSYEHHTGRAAHVRDSRRRNALVGMGWYVISVTAADIACGGDHLVTMIRAATSRLASTSADIGA